MKQRVQIPLRHFFATPPAPCPYLPDRMERKVVTLLLGEQSDRLHEALAHAGFRRSQDLAYRPACDSCSACVSVRVPVHQFAAGRSLKRVERANQGIDLRFLPPLATGEHYSLFRRYILARHSGGGMADMDFGDYRAMVEDTPVRTQIVEFRETGGRLYGVALTDRMDDGLSLVYSFFEPQLAGRSPGTYMILRHIQEALTARMGYVYLGYWVANSAKMAYKARFKPLEVLRASGWQRLDPTVTEAGIAPPLPPDLLYANG